MVNTQHTPAATALIAQCTEPGPSATDDGRAVLRQDSVLDRHLRFKFACYGHESVGEGVAGSRPAQPLLDVPTDAWR